jgi:hypothetical protein
VYYSLDLDRVRTLYLDSGQALHPALGEADGQPQTQAKARLGKQVRILFSVPTTAPAPKWPKAFCTI